MGLLDNLERKIEKAVRKPFAGRGGDLQPVELASALRNAADREIVTRQERSIAPNEITFRFGTAVYAKAREWGSPLAEELCDVLIRHARTQGYTLPADVQVRFMKDADLDEGEFVVDTEFTDAQGNPLPYGEHRHSHQAAHQPAKQQRVAPQRGVDETQLPPQPSTPPSTSQPADESLGLYQAAAPVYDEPEEPEFQGILTVAGQRYAIEGPSVVIGRSSAADIPVQDDGVSRRHLEIVFRDGTYWVRDLGSTNGTYLNGFPLNGLQELTDGSVLVLSGTRITFRLAERPPRPSNRRGSRFEPDSMEASS